jgi:membrane protein required for colicin V production
VNAFDVVLLVLLGALVLVGVIKGLTRILIGIGALALAFVLAAQLHESLGGWLGTWLDAPRQALLFGGYLAVLLGTLLLGAVAAFVVRRLVKAAMLGWADRLAGGALGLVAAALVAALVVLPLVAYSPIGQRVLERSVLAPYVAVVADLATRLAPEGLAGAYRERIEPLRRHWRERQEVSRVSRRTAPPAG